MRPLRRWGAAAAIASASACSLFTDLSGLTGQPPRSGDDGAVAAEAAVSPDASSDAPAADAARFCERMDPDRSALVCDDFDDGTLNGELDVAEGSSVRLDDGAAVSPPNALVANARPVSGGPCVYATADRLMSHDATGVRLDYDLFFGRPGGGGLPSGDDDTVAVAGEVELASKTGSGRCFYYLRLARTSTSLISEPAGSGALETRVLAATVQPGRWTHVTLLVEGPSTAPRVTVLLDGVVVLDKGSTPGACETGKVLSQGNGLLCVGAEVGSDIEVRIDNVLLKRLE